MDVVFRKVDAVLPKILSGGTSDVVPTEERVDDVMIVEETTERARALIRDSGPNGIIPADLAVRSWRLVGYHGESLLIDKSNELQQKLESEIPTVMAILVDLVRSGGIECLGWEHGRVVHKDHLEAWALTFGSRDAPPPTINNGVLIPNRAERHPRRIAYQWLDIYGEQNDKEWRLALNAVFGHVVMRPGINEVSPGTKGG